jgi:hypothetical protein
MIPRVVTIIILLLMQLAAPALAVSMDELSFDELFDEADQIVMATVQSVATSEDYFISATYTLFIEEVYKGNIKKNEIVEANQFLGYGGATYHRGNMVIVFLSGRSGSDNFSVVNGYQGLWIIDESGYLDGFSSFFDMDEFETELMEKGWVPDPNRETYTVYIGQLQKESKFPLQTVIIAIVAVLAGIVAIIIFKKRKKHQRQEFLPRGRNS